tara:strand:- start:1308 stop:1904 length:597 start_codon:yes stop_codon:yes gene_type:complete
MKRILNTDEINELLVVWFENKDDDGWITVWAIKDNFSRKKTTEKEKRIIKYMIANWEWQPSGSYVIYRPKKHWQYLRIGDEKMKRKYTCKKCGKNGHQARTCNTIDEDLSRDGKPFQFEEIQEEVIEYINEESVNHPSHYNPGNIEVIDAIEDWGLDFNAGNVIKYIVRSCSSGDNKHDKRQDLEKAIWYINRILNNE